MQPVHASIVVNRRFSQGKAHLRTGLPIFTHNNYSTGPDVQPDIALRQLDQFEAVGVRPEHVAVGHVCCFEDTKAEVGPLHARDGGPGYARPLLLFVPRLRTAGVTQEDIRRITEDNPRRFLAFVPKTAQARHTLRVSRGHLMNAPPRKHENTKRILQEIP